METPSHEGIEGSQSTARREEVGLTEEENSEQVLK